MLYVKRKNLFEVFFEKRHSLIIQFNNGDLTKKEFLKENFNFITSLNIKPFIKIDSFEKGMFNYQYYNSLAKYYLMLVNEIKNTNKHRKYFVEYKNTGLSLYHQKDLTTISILRLVDFENVDAYYVKTNSKFLNGKLYEIVLSDYKEAIFHSKALWLIDILREKNVFSEKKKESVIDSYINKLY